MNHYQQGQPGQLPRNSTTTPPSGYPTPVQPNSGFPLQSISIHNPQPSSEYPSQPSIPSTASSYPAQEYSQQVYSNYPNNSANTDYPKEHPYTTQAYPSAPEYPSNPQTDYPTSGYPQMNQLPSNPQYPPSSKTAYHTPGYTQTTQGKPTVDGYPQSTISHISMKWSKPTVVPVNPFDPRNDAAILRKAVKGTDEQAIIRVLTKRSNDQRQRIAAEYKTLYGKDLVSNLKSETSGKLRDLLVALMKPLPQFYAKELHDAIDDDEEDVLIEIMCTVTNQEINLIKEAYAAKYKKSLEADLRSDTSGHFKRLLTSLCLGNRSEDYYVDQELVKQDAKSLYEAGEKRSGKDEPTFNAVLCSRSYAQLAAIFQEYTHLTGHDIEDAIKKEFSGDLAKALKTIVKVVRNKPMYFAERLYKSMKGLGTNDRQLIRIMVTRCEVDLGDISDMFQSKYGESLKSWIEDRCSGDYKRCLLGLLNVYIYE